MRFIGAFYKVPAPANELAVQSWLYIKWTFRIEHPFYTLADNAGRRQRHKVTGTYIPGIAVRAAVAHIALINHGNIKSLLPQIKCAAEANDAATYYENVFCHVVLNDLESVG